MSKNNRQRRQQKKQQKKQQKSQLSGTSPKGISPGLLHEAELLFDIVTESIDDSDMPSPRTLKEFRRCASNPVLRELQQLLENFLNYIFLDATVSGCFSTLSNFKLYFKKTNNDSLYILLKSWCILDPVAINQGDVSSLETFQSEHPFTPPGLAFEIYRKLIKNDKRLHDWQSLLRQYLKNTKGEILLPLLKSFLKLKKPQPKLKTVQNLEAALATLDTHTNEYWYDGLKHIIQLFITRNSATQPTAKAWSQHPTLSALLDLKEEPSQSVSFTDRPAATLMQIEKNVDKLSLNFHERLQYELVLCRLLGEQASCQYDLLEFEKKLEALLTLCCSGVPNGQHTVAQQCIDHVLQWLCVEISCKRLLLIKASVLHSAYQKYPSDYRLSLLTFLGRGPLISASTPFHHIHEKLFFFALTHCKETNSLLDTFYWSLTGEQQKTLIFYVCRELLWVSSSEVNKENLWFKLQKNLFTVKRGPFKEIRDGKPCEAEGLFYYALIAQKAIKDKGPWIKSESVATVLRVAAQRMNPNTATWVMQSVAQLCDKLCTDHPDAVLTAMESMCYLIRTIDIPPEPAIPFRLDLLSSKKGNNLLKGSAELLFKHLHARDEHDDPRFEGFLKLCFSVYPELKKKLIPA